MNLQRIRILAGIAGLAYNNLARHRWNRLARTERRYNMNTMAAERMNDVQKTYRVEDIMHILDIGRNSAYNLVKENHFKVIRIGTAIRISRKSFDEWLENQV